MDMQQMIRATMQARAAAIGDAAFSGKRIMARMVWIQMRNWWRKSRRNRRGGQGRIAFTSGRRG